MRIILTGPRSVGKSTIGKRLARDLRLTYYSGDDLMEERLKDIGGIGVAIKNKKEEIIIPRFTELKSSLLKENDFLYDMAGGTFSLSNKSSIFEKEFLKLLDKSLCVGLLPYTEDNTSINLLVEREKERPHFKNLSLDELESKVKDDFNEVKEVLPDYCDKIFYVGEKSVEEIVEELYKYLKNCDFEQDL